MRFGQSCELLDYSRRNACENREDLPSQLHASTLLSNDATLSPVYGLLHACLAMDPSHE